MNHDDEMKYRINTDTDSFLFSVEVEDGAVLEGLTVTVTNVLTGVILGFSKKFKNLK